MRGCTVLSRCGLVLAVLLGAAAPARTEDDVRVCVVAILATERNNDVSHKLERIAREVQKTNPKLTGFRLGPMGRQSMTVGARKEFKLVEDQSATVTLEPPAPADKEKHYRIKVAPPLMGEFTYTSTCGKFLPIMTPYRTRDNDVLIIAVQVCPCRAK